MKKFFYLSCAISAIVIALCVVIVSLRLFQQNEKTFNVDIEGSRHYVTYKITGNLPPDEVVPFVKQKTDELRNDNNSNPYGFGRRE